MEEMNQYILRYVAGVHWLIKVDQQNTDYKAPFMLNEVGAFLWKLINNGCGLQELSIKLKDRYEMETDEALTDVMNFYNQLIEILTI